MGTTPVPGGNLVVSYLVLRKAIGYLGIALPFVLAFGNMLLVGQPGIQRSISSYYHTPMGDVFVGILCAIGVFMISYKGYERKDARAGYLACIFAAGVAWFPTAPDPDPTSQQELIGHVHLCFAALFFLTLSYFSLCLFTKTDKSTPTRRKLQRNTVYKICGYTMLTALALILVIAVVPDEMKSEILKWRPVFFLEAAAILAFGVSWLTKGEAILKDEP